METPEKSSKPKRLAIGSYQTALCLIPHATLCRDIDRLRALYDKGYGKWPPHINIIYPFVAIEDLPEAVDLVRSNLVRFGRESGNGKIHLRLEKSGHFSHRHSDTIYIALGDDGCSQSLEQLRSAILEDFDQHDELYHPHLTIGQSQVQDTSFRDYLLAKAALLLPIDLRVEELVVLVRERMHGQDNSLSQMKTWDTVSLFNDALIQPKRSRNFQEKPRTEGELSDEEEMQLYGGLQTITSPLLENLQISTDSTGARKTSATQQGVTYQFSPLAAVWEPAPISLAMPGKEEMPSALVVSSYNVLVDSIHPPVRDRYALLLRALLSESAVADVLVLQEVSDDFLSYLLGQTIIQSHYPFTTHGPPDQQGIGPLTSLRNIVVLSRWSFGWEWIPFDRRHKGAVILMFNTIGKSKDAKSVPLIVAGVHLTSGLTDSAVAAKKSQLQLLIDHLSREYAENPWVIAGDFNVTTSAFTIDAALKNKSISPQTANILSSFGTVLSNARLSDSWFIARTEIGETLRPSQYQTDFDDLNEGEQGATFDPTMNALAAEARGWGSNHRPQRYDRILFKGQDFLGVTGFNMFGFPEESDREKGDGNMESREAAAQYGSDHWGIRATLRINSNSEARELEVVGALSTVLQPRKAPSRLSDVASLKECLGKLSTIPSDDEINKRKEAFALVKNVLQQSLIQEIRDTADNKKSIISMVVVPVGSYSLGVWSTSSDIDCLCIGSISAKTFFALAVQRFRKVAGLGVRILRQVNASSGAMLELDIRGTKFDLQYCPATRIAERWPDAIQFPPSDPLFDLPLLSLTKLKSLRDLDYLRRTIPDLAAFRIAHRFIRAWAEQRGIYSSKFGYLGGFHITLMLSRICKFLFRDAGAATAADIICTFYHHYSNFDWKGQMVFDPFFHKQLPRYHRSAREPMVILGPHTPTVNVARTASLPSLNTLVTEMKRADDLLSEVGMTWSKFIGSAENESAMADLPSGAREFLQSYDSYIKINVQYWGLSLAKGSTLVGWLESRCVLLLVGKFLPAHTPTLHPANKWTDMNRKLPDIHARIWPARFTLNETNSQTERDYQGCYLIGLARIEPPQKQEVNESDRKTARVALRTTLEQFADLIRTDEKYFDATSSWLDVAHVKRSDLGDLKLDSREWGNHVVQEDDESDTVDEEEEPTLDADGDDEAAELSTPSKPKKVLAGNRTSKPVANQKLRPATDILNRLRWDPNLDSSDYTIGYEDRFLGPREMALGRWKTEQTDEEFIPQHRILYFRRTDGVVVWDRETRRDEIFGSGAGRQV